MKMKWPIMIVIGLMVLLLVSLSAFMVQRSQGLGATSSLKEVALGTPGATLTASSPSYFAILRVDPLIHASNDARLSVAYPKRANFKVFIYQTGTTLIPPLSSGPQVSFVDFSDPHLSDPHLTSLSTLAVGSDQQVISGTMVLGSMDQFEVNVLLNSEKLVFNGGLA